MCRRQHAIQAVFGLLHSRTWPRQRCGGQVDYFPGHINLALLSTRAREEPSVVIPTELDIGGSLYGANYDAMGELLHSLREKTKTVCALWPGGRMQDGWMMVPVLAVR